MTDTGKLSTLIDDVDQSVARRSEERRATDLRDMTELFLREANALDGTRAAVFGEVMGRLAAGAEPGARAELAGRLADAPNAPVSLVRTLAGDEIRVAAPLLARSSRLTDQDLAAIVAAKGQAHQLAITEREHLGEAVTDALVRGGHRGVAHAVACHPSARLSEASATLLVDRAGADGTLRALLQGRSDLAVEQQDQLLAVRGEGEGRAALTLDPGEGEGRALYGRALAQVQVLADMRPLTQDDLVAFLDGDEVAEAVCALALIVGLPISAAARLFERGRTELLLLVAKAQGWTWETVQRLLSLQGAVDPRLRDAYLVLEPAPAGRVLQALTARTRQTRPEPRQIRSKVR